jgi:hypothetical protein
VPLDTFNLSPQWSVCGKLESCQEIFGWLLKLRLIFPEFLKPSFYSGLISSVPERFRSFSYIGRTGNLLFKADNYARPVAESGILGLVHRDVVW